MAEDTLPRRPQTDEIAAPQMTAVRFGTAVIQDQMRPWLDEIGRDPRTLRGQWRAIHLLDFTLTDTKVRALLGQRLDAGVAAPLEIEPGGTARRDRMAAEDLAEQLSALEIDRITRELLHAIWYGYAIAECIWQIEGNRVRIADLRIRHPSVLNWDPLTLEPLLVTRQRPAGQPLPPAKFVLLTNPRAHGGQPFGPGTGAWCFWPVWLKRHNYSDWAVALERFGTPIALAKTRRNAPPKEIDEALRTLAAIAAGTSINLPEGVEIQILESSRRSGGDFQLFSRDMDRMIADAIVGQHGTAEIGQHVGTGEVHMKVLERLVSADARRCASALRRSIATWLTTWNFPGAAIPRLARDTAPPEDLEARARRDLLVSQASGRRPAPAYIEQVYGGEWEEGPGRSPDTGQNDARLAAGAPAADAISGLVDRLVGEDIALQAAAATILPVEEAIAGATSLEDLRTRLDRIDEAPPPDALAQLYARADFIAGMAGNAGVPLADASGGSAALPGTAALRLPVGGPDGDEEDPQT